MRTLTCEHSHTHTHAHTHTHTRTQVYTYERGDGVGRAHDLVIQGFIRGVATAAFPVAICAGVLYVLVGALHCAPVYTDLIDLIECVTLCANLISCVLRIVLQ